MRDPIKTFRNATIASSAMWICIILLLVTCSCNPYHIVTQSKGVVLQTDLYEVEVAYKVMNSKRGSKEISQRKGTTALNIYYYPQGHNYRVGDIYPKCYEQDRNIRFD